MSGHQISGDLGERIVAEKLSERGWTISWPRRNKPNIDLYAERNKIQRCIQVKTSAEKEGPDWIAAGKCSDDVLYKGASMLNRVYTEDKCDVVICVSYLKQNPQKYRIFVFSVDDAEYYFRRHAVAYYTKKKRDGSRREPGPVFIKVGGEKAYSGAPDDRAAISRYEEAWEYLEEAV